MGGKQNFIFFESWERYLKALEDDKDLDYVNAVARAIIQYGLYGEIETTDQTILRKVDAVCSDLMMSTKTRYNASMENGRRGGRPSQYDPSVMQQMKESGLTEQEIAKQLGCNVRTVQRALSKYEESETQQNDW